MTVVVIDASALLAFLWREPGWERVAACLEAPGATMSAVNVAEIASKLGDKGVPGEEVARIFAILDLDIASHDTPQALATGQLRPLTRALGLSLGDRACLALARSRQALALTADRPWLELAEPLGIAIEYIRPDAH